MRASLAKHLDQALQVVDSELDAIPAARFGTPSVGHEFSGASTSARRAEQQLELTARKHREPRRRLHLDGKPEVLDIE
jgi:hypothetical protein